MASDEVLEERMRLGINNMIPNQFMRDDFLFVPVPRGEKAPRMHGWNLVAKGMRYDDKRLDNGGNYSVYAAPGSTVLFLDVDDAERFDYSILGGETFTYSAWPDLRRYRAVVECPDYPRSWAGKKMRVLDGALEVYFPAEREKTGGLVVGPGSLHPNGNLYAITHNTSFRTVLWSALARLLPAPAPVMVRPRRAPSRVGKKPLRERYGLKVEWPVNPYPTRHGEVRGASPFHDSSTGDNTAIDPEKGLFYCFRHEVGYDAAGCEAIRRGIIECGDPFDETAYARLVAELERDFPEVSYLEKVNFRRRMKAERRRKREEARNHD
jgi:hypothetical protein